MLNVHTNDAPSMLKAERILTIDPHRTYIVNCTGGDSLVHSVYSTQHLGGGQTIWSNRLGGGFNYRIT